MKTPRRLILRRKHDPLGRSEPDPVERLHAMARDALAGKDQDAVDREVERAVKVLGLDRKVH